MDLSKGQSHALLKKWIEEPLKPYRAVKININRMDTPRTNEYNRLLGKGIDVIQRSANFFKKRWIILRTVCFINQFILISGGKSHESPSSSDKTKS